VVAPISTNFFQEVIFFHSSGAAQSRKTPRKAERSNKQFCAPSDLQPGSGPGALVAAKPQQPIYSFAL
jgi:hypothetical protein